MTTSLIERAFKSAGSLGSTRAATRGDSLTSLVSKNGPTAAAGSGRVGAAATISRATDALAGADVSRSTAGATDASRAGADTRTGLAAGAGLAATRCGRAGGGTGFEGFGGATFPAAVGAGGETRTSDGGAVTGRSAGEVRS